MAPKRRAAPKRTRDDETTAAAELTATNGTVETAALSTVANGNGHPPAPKRLKSRTPTVVVPSGDSDDTAPQPAARKV